MTTRARKPAAGTPRRLRVSILRYNPQDPESRPRLEPYEIEEAEGMTLFIALNDIRAYDPAAEGLVADASA